MAQGKYTRIDNRRQSSSYCSNVTIVAFVALCLVGVWMMTSSSVVPSQNADENKDEVKQQVIENSTKQLEDSQGDNPEDARKDSESTVKQGENDPAAEGNEEVNLQEKPEEEKPEEKSEDEKPQEKSEEKHEEEKPEEKSEEKHEDEKEEKPEEKSEDEKPQERSEEKHEEEKPEEKSEEKHEDEKPEEKSEDKSEEEKPEEKSGDKTADTHDEVTPEEKAKEKIEGKSDEDDRTKSQTQPNDESVSETQGGSNSEGGNTKSDGEGYPDENGNKPDPDLVDKKDPSDDTTKKPDDDFAETKEVETGGSEAGDKGDKTDKTGSESSSDGTNNQGSSEVFPSAAQADLLNETVAQGGSFSTQAAESKNEKETQLSSNDQHEYNWKLCNSTAGSDYIPCLDNLQVIKSLKTTKHYEHRERHCPESPPTCLVPLPEGYKTPIDWPKSRDKIWYYNVPHTKLAQVKGHQNWVKVTGEYLTFPGGGTQFTHGALHYIDFINESVPDVAWGKRTRVILDVGCGVASFGGYLFDRDVLTMSFAPKDEHEAQVQFALERGIPAISAVMGTKRLPFPGIVFDAVHCARCRVPWHIEGGKLLLELNRVLRPGGFFLWSATPVYQKLAEDVEIWNAMTELTKAMCWELVSMNKDTINGVGVATFRKPSTNECYDKRSLQEPPMCEASDDRNAAWNVPLQSCMHNVPVDSLKRGSQWPEQWPVRLEKSPYWMLSSQVGVYGKPEPEDFTADYEHWKRVVSKSYLKGLGINWATVRNVMDMRSIYGGFAAALKDINAWVMNVVPIDSPDTLPIIYERGLFGIYHDWCESFNTYPRTYDLLHADHLFSKIKKRCNLVAVVAEVDRILRPDGKLIVRDNVETMGELENLLKSMKWEVRMTYSKDNEGLLCVQKSVWRPTESETITYAIA